MLGLDRMDQTIVVLPRTCALRRKTRLIQSKSCVVQQRVGWFGHTQIMFSQTSGPSCGDPSGCR